MCDDVVPVQGSRVSCCEEVVVAQVSGVGYGVRRLCEEMLPAYLILASGILCFLVLCC